MGDKDMGRYSQYLRDVEAQLRQQAKETQEEYMSEGFRSEHNALLNALDEMQQSFIYAARKGVLAQAEETIVALVARDAKQREELEAYRNGGLTEDILRKQNGFMKLGTGCTVVRSNDWDSLLAELEELKRDLATLKHYFVQREQHHQSRGSHGGPARFQENK